MAEPVVSFVVERLGDFLIEEAKFIHGVGGQVQDIYDELKWMKAFLKDADNKKGEDERICVWVDNVRTLAYDASDVLESFLLRVESKKAGGIKNILKRYVCILNECVHLHIVGSEILNIQSRISGLKLHLETYGIRSLTESTSPTQETLTQLRRTYSHTVEDDFVGFEDDVKDLVDYLADDAKGCYMLVSICGLGGSGKSTIARKVYNHTKVKHHFEAFAWICVSQNWQASDIMQQILTKFIPQEKDEIKKLSAAEMIRKLFELQQKKSCLIVLDDIWKKDAWDCIKEAFPRNTKSKLLLTSRNKDVAIHMNPDGFHYEPRALSEYEAWVLLEKKTFSKNVHHYPADPNERKEMEKLGIKMVRQCKGLPLGVVVLGGILASKLHLQEWKNVSRNIKSVIRGESREKEHGGVSRVLDLSYSDLPYYLKPCFLYLSKFRDDTEIDAERLYQLWMAESMVLSSGKGDGQTMMDLAESYLGELAQRSMVQVQLNDERGYEFKKIKSCRMHDMIRELCLTKAKEEDFFQTIDFENKNENDVGSPSSSTSARRVAIYFEGENGCNRVVSINKNSGQQLRALLILNEGKSTYDGHLPIIANTHLSDFKLLRSLAIEGFSPETLADYSIETQLIPKRKYFRLPNAIGNLIHLRYLSLENTVFIMFPACIKKLKHLQTLVLRGCRFICFERCMEDVLSEMNKLQHIYLPYEIEQKVSGNRLRLGNSINLEILDDFDPSWGRTEDLMKLKNLQKFGARIKTNHLEATKEIMSYLSSTMAKNIRDASLRIDGCDFTSDEWLAVFTELVGSSGVHRLILWGPMSIDREKHDNSTLPLLSRLTQLDLHNSQLKKDSMPILETYSNLLHLTLWSSFQGTEMSCSTNGFPRLKTLEIQNMDNLQSLEIKNGAMPRLSKLEFARCKCLKTIPYGLRFVTSLQTLRITEMPKEFEEKAREVRNGGKGEDFEKIGHVPYIIIVESKYATK